MSGGAESGGRRQTLSGGMWRNGYLDGWIAVVPVSGMGISKVAVVRSEWVDKGELRLVESPCVDVGWSNRDGLGPSLGGMKGAARDQNNKARRYV